LAADAGYRGTGSPSLSSGLHLKDDRAGV